MSATLSFPTDAQPSNTFTTDAIETLPGSRPTLSIQNSVVTAGNVIFTNRLLDKFETILNITTAKLTDSQVSSLRSFFQSIVKWNKTFQFEDGKGVLYKNCLLSEGRIEYIRESVGLSICSFSVRIGLSVKDYALELNGKNQYASINPGGTMGLPNSSLDRHSFIMRFKTQTKITVPLFRQRTGNIGYNVDILSNGKIRVFMGGTASTDTFDSTILVNDGLEQTILVSYTAQGGSNKTIDLHINGVSDGSVGEIIGDPTNAADFLIGKGSGNDYFPGKISYFAFINDMPLGLSTTVAAKFFTDQKVISISELNPEFLDYKIAENRFNEIDEVISKDLKDESFNSVPATSRDMEMFNYADKNAGIVLF